MIGRIFWLGAALSFVATAGVAGIPTTDTLTCPTTGKTFKVAGTASCTTFGGSQDFFLLARTSCDFVTKLPQCPENGLPLYKDFSPAEIALLKEYVGTDEYRLVAGRSRFVIAKKVDDYLTGKGSKSAFGFWYALAGLQYDRASTQNDPEYITWVKEKAAIELTRAEGADATVIRLVLAYLDYLAGNFEAAEAGLKTVQTDASVKEHWLVGAYFSRLTACVKAHDTSLCPSDGKVKADAG